MTARVSAPPQYRGLPLSTRPDIERAATVTETEGGLLAHYPMSGTRFWLARGGGWFEQQAERPAASET